MGQVRAGVVSRSLVVLAWLALVPVIGAFILLRLNTSHNALLAAQVVFLVPVALAAVVAEFAYFFGPRGVERKAWGMLSLTVMVLLMSEGYYSWYQVSVSPAGPPSPSLYDVLNLIAALMIATTLVILSGVTRESPAQRLRLGCDALALTSAVYAGLYHFWVRVLPPSTPWNELARWTGYSLVGFIVVVGTLWLASSAIYRSEREIYSLVGVSLLIFSAGMILWPVWRSGTPGTAGTLDVVVSAIYLLGYYLLMVAGLVRLRDARLPWGEDGVRPIRTERVAVHDRLGRRAGLHRRGRRVVLRGSYALGRPAALPARGYPGYLRTRGQDWGDGGRDGLAQAAGRSRRCDRVAQHQSVRPVPRPSC